MTDVNFADAWETIADVVPNRVALICRDQSISYSQLEARANQLAHWMRNRGIGSGDHVGVYMQNCFEYVEVMWAAFKLRAVPININFRYVADELVYLFNDADLAAVVYHPEFADTLAIATPSCPTLRWSLAVGPDYEKALSEQSAQRDFAPRSGDDQYLIYTGGTTGTPKGVVWRQDDAFYACLGGQNPSLPPITTAADLVGRIAPTPIVAMILAPLMHAAGGWSVMSHAFAGNTVVLWSGPLEGTSVWQTVAQHKVEGTAVVGDAVMRPLLDGWDKLPDKPDVSSLKSVFSGGAPLAPALRDRFLATFKSVNLGEVYGSSETGTQAARMFAAGSPGNAEPAYTAANGVVLDEDTQKPVAPGSGKIGRIARTGRIPLAYYGDTAKTASTFVEWDGRRWALTGDMATVEADGSIRLLGRGSLCINSGGEKIFPEEVEAVLRQSSDVYDVVVVGVPDERWGQAVVAVVALAPGASATEASLRTNARLSLAGYKVPKRVVFVDQVLRSPSGKADYRWGTDVALKSLSET